MGAEADSNSSLLVNPSTPKGLTSSPPKNCLVFFTASVFSRLILNCSLGRHGRLCLSILIGSGPIHKKFYCKNFSKSAQRMCLWSFYIRDNFVEMRTLWWFWRTRKNQFGRHKKKVNKTPLWDDPRSALNCIILFLRGCVGGVFSFCEKGTLTGWQTIDDAQSKLR